MLVSYEISHTDFITNHLIYHSLIHSIICSAVAQPGLELYSIRATYDMSDKLSNVNGAKHFSIKTLNKMYF